MALEEKLSAIEDILRNIKPSAEIEKQAVPRFMGLVRDEINRYKARVLSKSHPGSLWTMDAGFPKGINKIIYYDGEEICPIIKIGNNNKKLRLGEVGAFFRPYDVERHDKDSCFHLMLEVPESMYEGVNACRALIMADYNKSIGDIVDKIKIRFLSGNKREKIYNKLNNFSLSVLKTDKLTLDKSEIILPRGKNKEILFSAEFIYANKFDERIVGGGVRRNRIFNLTNS